MRHGETPSADVFDGRRKPSRKTARSAIRSPPVNRRQWRTRTSGEDATMKSRDWFAMPGLCLALVALTTPAHAQASYPSKTVTIICDSAAGSTPDVDTRFFAEGLSKRWGQQVITVNHPGGGGSIGARAAAAAEPDGYTLYMPVLSDFVARPGIAPNLPLMLPRDFIALGFTAENPMFIAVTPTLGVSTLAELIALAKTKPGEITYATTGVGRLTHLAGELLQMRAGINLLLVPYTGGPSHAVADVANGRVSLIIEGYSGIAASIKSGLLKPIACPTFPTSRRWRKRCRASPQPAGR
jgi:tripartite-type tricarboxylate transporter receptor subunit TctC